jgi:CheY-like chemotaxis protein
MLVSPQGQVVVWNRPAIAQTGFDGVGKSWKTCVRHVVSDRRARHRLLLMLRHAFAKNFHQLSLEIPSPSNSKEFMEARVFALRDVPGDLPAVLVIGQAPAAKQRSDDKLVAGLAHKLNDPLASLVVSAELLIDDESLGEDTRRRLQVLVREARRCSDVLQNAVGVVKNVSPSAGFIDLHETIREVVDSLRDELRAAGVELTLSLAATSPPVPVPRERLRHALVELLSCLAPPSARMGGSRSFRIRTQPSRRSVYVVVELPHGWLSQDDQEGPAPISLEEEIRRPPCLDPAAAVVRAIGGDLRVSQMLGTGDAVILRLPAVSVPGSGALRSVSRRPVFSGQRVLVVDDEEVILELLQAVLARWGLEVETASDGAEALSKIRRLRYDLILSDIKMPNLDGKGLYRAVQEIQPQLADRIIFSTGDTASDTTAAFLEQLGNPYLTKPFDMDDLKLTIARTLTQSHSPVPQAAP